MNNTTKFFSLIEKKATLLQSCLLHRYFNIVRLKRLNSLIQSSRANDEVRLSDLTTMLGMDNDEDTKEYLEQFEYSFTTSTPICFIVPSSPAENPSSFTNKLSQKLIKSKYNGNLKDVREKIRLKTSKRSMRFFRSSVDKRTHRWSFPIHRWKIVLISMDISLDDYLCHSMRQVKNKTER